MQASLILRSLAGYIRKDLIPSKDTLRLQVDRGVWGPQFNPSYCLPPLSKLPTSPFSSSLLALPPSPSLVVSALERLWANMGFCFLSELLPLRATSGHHEQAQGREDGWRPASHMSDI